MSFNLLIVGLGNPGVKYENTRHNLGATWVKKLCRVYKSTLKNNSKLHASIIEIPQLNIICMLPSTYMNESGLSVSLVANFYKLAPQNILVVHDELHLPVGTIKLKLSGGHGGHNGLKSLIDKLNSNQFKRLRIGIAAPISKEDLSNYVLNSASLKEQLLIDRAIEKSLDVISDIVILNWNKAIQKLHSNKLENYNGF